MLTIEDEILASAEKGKAELLRLFDLMIERLGLLSLHSNHKAPQFHFGRGAISNGEAEIYYDLTKYLNECESKERIGAAHFEKLSPIPSNYHRALLMIEDERLRLPFFSPYHEALDTFKKDVQELKRKQIKIALELKRRQLLGALYQVDRQRIITTSFIDHDNYLNLLSTSQGCLSMYRELRLFERSINKDPTLSLENREIYQAFFQVCKHEIDHHYQQPRCVTVPEKILKFSRMGFVISAAVFGLLMILSGFFFPPALPVFMGLFFGSVGCLFLTNLTDFFNQIFHLRMPSRKVLFKIIFMPIMVTMMLTMPLILSAAASLKAAMMWPQVVKYVKLALLPISAFIATRVVDVIRTRLHVNKVNKFLRDPEENNQDIPLKELHPKAALINLHATQPQLSSVITPTYRRGYLMVVSKQDEENNEVHFRESFRDKFPRQPFPFFNRIHALDTISALLKEYQRLPALETRDKRIDILTKIIAECDRKLAEPNPPQNYVERIKANADNELKTLHEIEENQIVKVIAIGRGRGTA